MSDQPESPKPKPAANLGGLDVGELLARGLDSVKPSAGAGPWEPPTPEALAKLLPQYRIESLLGRGGMGAVYKGVQVALDRPVAIKLLPAELAGDGDFMARFQREARTLARLQHPGIVAVHDFGQTSAGHLYFVMEYVDGTDLQQVLKGPGLKPEQAFELIAQICDALYAAHRQGVIHRDIKPANILMTRDGRAKLADFGLARPLTEDSGSITMTNVIMGTPDYMAPESRSGVANADHRADIFALGVMLYEMLTGQRPHGAFQPPSKRVQVDVRIDEVVLKALQQEPERRYQQASEMKVDVDRIRTTPPGKAKPAWKLPGKELLIAGAVILAILAVSWAVHRSPLQSPSNRVAASSPATAPQSNPAPPVSTGPGWKPLLPPDSASMQAKSDDGWFQTTLWNANQKDLFADGAIRIQTRWTERGWIWMNLRNTSDRLVELKINNLGRVQLTYRYDGQEKGRREMQLPAFKVGQQVTIQLAVAGTTAMARVDDRQLTLPGLLSSWVGSMRIGGGTGETAVWVKPGEFLHLDGVTDPLKALGWEVAENSATKSSTVNSSGDAAEPTAAGWTSLLPYINPDLDAVKGHWRRVAGGLQGEATYIEGTGGTVLQLPYESPQEYDFRITYTAIERDREATQILSVGGRQFSWATATGQWGQGNSRWAGFNRVNGKNMSDSPAAVKLAELPALNRRYTSLVEVRRDRVTGYLDGKKIVDWPTNYREMQRDETYALPNSRALGIGIWWGKTTFHDVSVREVTGKGKLLRGVQPTVPAAQETASAVAASPPPALAPSRVYVLAGHRYQFQPGAVPWAEAKAKAEKMGGHLMTVTSREENDWLVATFKHFLSIANKTLWLGAIQETPGGAWKWVTGEPFVFTAWLPAEPNGVRGSGGVVGAPFMLNFCKTGNDFGWNDSSTHISQTNNSIGFIVEWDDAGPAKSASANATKGAPATTLPGRTALSPRWTSLLAVLEAVRREGFRFRREWRLHG